ncbi:MAG: S8 family serine peptidase [Bacteroidales bacterium]|nr:S8 family serine peptidase [Bacteroidales bacterium]
MKNLFTLFLAIIFLFQINSIAQASTSKVITSHLQEQMQQVNNDDFIRINITLHEQFDSQKLISQAQSLVGEARREYVVSVLKDFSALSQQGVVAQLNELQRASTVQKVTTYWIANVINCYATPEAIKALENLQDIASIDYDEYRVMLDPNESKNAFTVEGNPGDREITWNVLKINADDVWALGYNGEGVIVAVIDTGVNYDHYDLQDHVWESAEYPNHGYDFVNNDNDPKDDHGHGTHCSGTVAGDGTAGSQTGIAPEATIMCLKVLDSGGGGSESGVWAAAEFAVEQGAHVMSLSLGWQHSWGVNRTVWRQTFDNALAAGVVASVAAGNEGDQQSSYPIPDNVRTPGDCPPPWLHPDQTLTGGVSGVICVGSTTSSDAVSGFSSRGPLDWSTISQYNDYPYSPEMGLIRPDVSAPGSNIKSLDYSSNTGYADGWSGTSMATPANAGMIALMLQKNMTLSPAQISQISEETTVVLQAGKNNNSGSGRIDCLAAVNATSMPGPSYYAHSLNDAGGNNNGEVDPGEAILLTLSMANFSESPVSGVTVEISTDNEYLTITDNSEYFGDFALEDIIEMEDAFAFDVANNVPGGEEIKINIQAFNNDEAWQSSFTITANGVALMASDFSINDASGNGNGGLDPGETVDIYINISNDGQIDALNAMSYISSTDPFVTINISSFDLETLDAGETVEAMFNISVDEAAPLGTSVDLTLLVEAGDYMLEHTFFPKVGLIVDDFETGDFSKFPYEFGGNANWTITSSGAYEGTYAAKSGQIGDQQTSELHLSVEVANNDTISFYAKVSSEAGYDYLQFYINNDMMDEWAGNLGWTKFSYPVQAGEVTFKWVYEKDYSVANGDDCGWIDFLELPAMVDETMTVSAGSDTEICEGMEYETNATAQNFETLLWETSGTGTFDDNTNMDAMYMPSQDDWNAGMVTLSLTVYGGGNNMTDDMELAFMPLPADAGSISGLSPVCAGWSENYMIDEVNDAIWYHWVLMPEEAGTIDNTAHEVTINWSAAFNGDATLTVQGMNDCGEGTFSAEYTVTVDACTGIDEVSVTGISISPNPTDGLFTLSTKISEGIAEIIDLSGKVVLSIQLSAQNNVIDASALNGGMYFIKVQNQRSMAVEKLIIRK